MEDAKYKVAYGMLEIVAAVLLPVAVVLMIIHVASWKKDEYVVKYNCGDNESVLVISRDTILNCGTR